MADTRNHLGPRTRVERKRELQKKNPATKGTLWDMIGESMSPFT